MVGEQETGGADNRVVTFRMTTRGQCICWSPGESQTIPEFSTVVGIENKNPSV